MLWRLENIILKLVCEKVVMRQSFPFPLTSTFRFRLSYYFRNFDNYSVTVVTLNAISRKDLTVHMEKSSNFFITCSSQPLQERTVFRDLLETARKSVKSTSFNKDY